MPTVVKIIFLLTRSSKEDMKEASAKITKTPCLRRLVQNVGKFSLHSENVVTFFQRE